MASLLTKGQQVEANSHGRGEWLPGRIIKVPKKDGGTFTVLYDEGGTENGVSASNIRAQPRPFAVGDEVEADFQARWWPAPANSHSPGFAPPLCWLGAHPKHT